MKKIIYILLFANLMVSCENQDIDFPDFDFNAVYFPYQYPVRTLILGEDRTDNSRDKELKFLIGAVIGGMYENTSDWIVEFEVDESLAEDLVTSNGDTIRALPSAYYTISPSGVITIPAGSFNGTVEIQLNESFLDDSLAITGNYVIPLIITDSNADSVLSGLPNQGLVNPDKRNVNDWDANNMPKDFVLFGIKYINKYHGYYLQRGVDYSFMADGVTPIDTVTYREKYVEFDRIRQIITSGKATCILNGVGRNTGGNETVTLRFNENGDILADSTSSSPVKAFGTGKFLAEGDAWGGIAQNAIYLELEYLMNGNIHKVYDTLVFRNNGVVFEENVVSLIEP